MQKNQLERFPIWRHYAVAVVLMGLGMMVSGAQEWPQWRGVNRDGKTDFTAPEQWPAKLTLKWRVPAGLGDATPALVNEKLFVFGRTNDQEIIHCLAMEDGKEIWSHSYQAVAVTGPAEKYQGPRSSPAVADGKLVTLGVGGVLLCLDAATGKEAWRLSEFTNNVPLFFTAMSPLLADGLCVAHLGGNNTGEFIAVELETGKLRWKQTGVGPSYSSPTLTSVSGVRQIVMLTESNLTGLSLAEGKPLWTVPTSQKPGYWNSASPVADSSIVYYSGQGTGARAVKIEKHGDAFEAKELWHNSDIGTVYNTPILKEGCLYGLSDRGQFFCLEAATGRTAWTSTNRVSNFGSIVDAGKLLVALPEKSGLVVFSPDRQRYNEIARLSVSSTPIYAHPVLSGRRIFIRDADSIALWTASE